MIDDVMTAKSSQWYSKFKRMTNFQQEKSDIVHVEVISHLSDEDQAEAIADAFSNISKQYDPIKTDEISFPPFPSSSIPEISCEKVKYYLKNIKVNKSNAPGDIPAKILKEYADFLCVPITDMLNESIQSGQWPKIFKTETVTPAPKQFPPENCEMLRPIANLFNIDQIMEKIVAEMVIDDMKAKFDPKQFGNQQHLGIQHYLVRLLHRILTSVDNNKKGEITAVLCLFVDWKQAFSRQCHTLGIESFRNNGVRASLLPLLSSYLQGRQMRVKWRGKLSKIRDLPGGGAMGATLGIWEFLSQTNNNADCVPVEDRFKFVDDLTALEVLNLVNIIIYCNAELHLKFTLYI